MAYRYTLDTSLNTNHQERKTKDQLTDIMKTTMHSNNQFHNNCSDWKDDHIVKFKVFLEEDQRQRVKTIKLPLQTLSIDHLEAQVVKCFKVEREGLKRMTLCHQDKEKDLIITTSIASDEELHRAISAFVASKRKVCLRVTMKNSSSSKKENEATTPAVVRVDVNSEGCSRSNTTVSVNALTTVDKTEDKKMSSLQLSEIEAKGFANKRLNIRLLKKNDHNVEKVIQVLTQISERRQEKRKNKVNKLQVAYEELSPLLSELETKGFTNKRKNIRLLKKYDNEVGKVLQILSGRRQAILARREARLALKGTKQEQQINQAA